jgi:hypothetical protein
MKSEKPVKKLEEIVLPFLLKPTEIISGGISGQNFFFEPGHTYEITYPQYENLMGSQYAGQLKN